MEALLKFLISVVAALVAVFYTLGSVKHKCETEGVFIAYDTKFACYEVGRRLDE
jgi:predicted nuclease with RNAse H fold